MPEGAVGQGRLKMLADGLLRYSLAVIGPIGSAAAQFVLLLVLLRVSDPAAFGRFSFLLITSQFSLGIWSALFCAPLPILLTGGTPDSRRALLRCLMAVNLLGTGAAFVVFVVIGLLLREGPIAALLFAGYAAIALPRWFARTHAYAAGTPLRTTAADIVYCTVLLAGALLIATLRAHHLEYGCAALLVSTILGLLPFGRAYLTEQFLRLSRRDLRAYHAIWRQHSGWSLLGVLTIEATANAHAYIVTLVLGPTAFAPLAASALAVRPISVATNALNEYERAQMARQIGDGRPDRAAAGMRLFRLALIAAWAAVVAAVILLFEFAPHVIFPAIYDLSYLATGTALWMIVAAIRLLRAPESTLLQAIGAFRSLALASSGSAVISIGAVVVLLYLGGPLWSIGGIMLGEMVFAVWMWRHARRFYRSLADHPRDAAEAMAL